MAKEKNKTGGNLSFEDKLYTMTDNYIISLVSGKRFVDYKDSHSAENKMPRTNWNNMGCYPLTLELAELAQAFQDYVAPLHQWIGFNIRQKRCFTGLRDTLLLELLRGKLDLPAADKVEEVVL